MVVALRNRSACDGLRPRAFSVRHARGWPEPSCDSAFREPVVAKEFTRVQRPDRSVSAGEIVGRAVLVAAPAHAFGMRRPERKLAHESSRDRTRLRELERPRE